MKSFSRSMLPRFARLTVVLLYLVVVAGAVVRATGSGMGCPDWPKCYGELVPPTSVDQVDFARLDIDKFRAAWQRKGHDPIEVTKETLRRDFDARATWTEFINRVIGALSGLSALATLMLSFIAHPKRVGLHALLVLQLGLFAMVAWLGKVVVDTNLLPWKITAHMGLAVALITTALLILHLVQPGAAIPVSSSLRWHLLAAALFTVVQVFVGTQVRETVDALPQGACCDGRLETHLGVPFVWHRVGAFVVITLVAGAFFRLKSNSAASGAAPWLSTLPGLVVALEYAAGVVLIKAGLTAALQPVHLVLAVVLHGMLFCLILRSRLQTTPAPATMALQA